MINTKQIFFLFALFLGILTAHPLFASYFEQGCHLYVYKNYTKAKEMFLKDVEKTENGDSYYFLGEIEKIEGNYDKAREYYETAITKKISKKYLRLAYWNLIVLTEQRGNYAEMVKSLKIFWKRTADHGAKQKVESLINKSMWSDNKEAKEMYEKGIELKKKKRTDDSEEYFKKAIELDSSFLAPRFELGLIEYKRGNMNDAAYYFREVSNKIPFYGEIHLMLGEIYLKTREFRKSIEHLTWAIEYGFIGKKTEHQILLMRATAHYNLGDYEKAMEDIAESTKLHKGRLEPLFLLSAIYIKEKEYEKALKTLQSIKKIKGNNNEVIFQIGTIYYKMENPRYIDYFDKLFNQVKDREKDVPDKYYKAFIFLIKKHFGDSKFQRVVSIFEFLPESHRDNELKSIAAKSYYYLGKYGQAIKFFESISLNDEDTFLLCKAYAKNDMKDKARETLNRLYSNKDYFQKALSDRVLKNIAKEIEKENNIQPKDNDNKI